MLEVGSDIGIWYAAHIVMYIELVDGALDYCPVWENIYLIQAENPSDAFDKADKIGKFLQETSEVDGTTFGDKRAHWKFAGVRRLAECIDLSSGTGGDAEVTYLEYTVSDKETLDKIMSGQPSRIVLEPQKRIANGEQINKWFHPELLL